MKRYNFDKIPPMASGFAVHAETMKQAWGMAYALAKKKGYNGKLKFRDNMKCPKRSPTDPNVLRGHGCSICHPKIHLTPASTPTVRTQQFIVEPERSGLRINVTRKE